MSGLGAGQARFLGVYVRITWLKRSGISAKNRPICPDYGSGVSYSFQGSSWRPPQEKYLQRA